MAETGYVFDPLYLEHARQGHPESPDRLQTVMSHLGEAGLLTRLLRVEPRDATIEDLELVHSRRLIEEVRVTAHGGGIWLDADTYVSRRSFEAALRATGGALAGLDAVLEGRVGSTFCLLRPPGHHATPDRAMGFCLFNNVAVAAAYALERRGLERVAIVDFDVHHGNGTQDAFYDDPRVLYFSTHQSPFYPGTGDWNETGSGSGEGTTVNVPLPDGCGPAEYLRVFREVCEPVVRRFRPDILLVSAGFDAHFADPLAHMRLDCEAYYEIGGLLKGLADEICRGRIVYALEGGYNLSALAWSVMTCIDTLLGLQFVPDPLGRTPVGGSPDIDRVLSAVKRVQGL